MAFMEFFEDWEIKTVSFYKEVETLDSNGQTVKTPSLVGTSDCGTWVDTSIETNVNDKFVNSEVGRFALDYPSFTIDTNTYALISSVKYYIIGVDNIASQNDVLLLTYRKDV